MHLWVCGDGAQVHPAVHGPFSMHMCVWGTQMCIPAFSSVYLQLTLYV